MTLSGRWIGSRQSKYEVLAARTGEISPPLSLSENDLSDLLEDRKNGWSLADRIAFEIDWGDFISLQSQRDQKIAGLLAKGYRRSEAAHAVGLRRPAVTQRMNRLRDHWAEFQEDALH
ncbi:MAG: hypothetical protein GXP25_03375 [Planctomycetes bacterium]|nr:hypothetical protein [Planctomycetota bacterium]